MLPIFYGTVEKGKLKIDNQTEFLAYLCSLKGNVQVSVGRRRKPRSIQENNYYFGVVVKTIGDEIGEAPQRTHELLKSLFLKEITYKTIRNKPERFERIKSTTELSTVEMEVYLEEIRRWAAEFLNVSIPEPNQVE